MPLDPRLLLLCLMDESGSTDNALGQTANGYYFTHYGGANPSGVGVRNGARTWNGGYGGSVYRSHADSLAFQLGEWTVGGWFKRSAAPAFPPDAMWRLERDGHVTFAAVYLRLVGLYPACSIDFTSGPAITVTDPVAVVPGVYDHHAVSWDGETLRLFRNAVVVDSATSPGSQINYSSIYSASFIGSIAGPGGANGWYGEIDEVFFANEALGADDIARYMAGNFDQVIVVNPEQYGDAWLINDAGDYELTIDGHLKRDPTPLTRGRIRLRTRRGEWFDDVNMGSRLHQVRLLKNGARFTEGYVREALQPMLDDGTYKALRFGLTHTDHTTGALLRVVEAEQAGEELTSLALPLGDADR